MADDLTKRGGQDRERININQDHELRNWAQRLGVSAEALKKAVASVGDRAEKVKAYFQGNRSK